MILDRLVSFLATITLLHEASGYATDLCGSDHLGVIDGHAIPIEDAPYMAALSTKLDDEVVFFFYCGATIIHEQFLLTAAHCATDRPVRVSIGSNRYRKTNTNTIIEVEKFIPHKDFNFGTGDNDICLVKLKKPVPFGKTVAEITLADEHFKIAEGTALNATGWGWTRSTHKPLDLQRTTVPVISNTCCHDADKTFDDNMICAGAKGRGVCHGDSGGPLTLNDVQVGIVSRAASSEEECGDGVDVYTRVSRYQDWIKTNLQNNL